MTGCSGAKVCRSARLGAARAPGAAGDLGQELEGALGRAHVAEGEAEIGVDHADQGEIGEIVPLGDELGADDDVDLALGDRRKLEPEPLHAAGDVARHDDACAPRESAAATSSASRSTPGPTATRLSASPQFGQASGRGSEWPQ